MNRSLITSVRRNWIEGVKFLIEHGAYKINLALKVALRGKVSTNIISYLLSLVSTEDISTNLIDSIKNSEFKLTASYIKLGATNLQEALDEFIRHVLYIG